MDLLAFAKTIADRVETEASRARMPVAVCVIDVHGNVVLHHRMSGAPTFSIELSERKAYTSALVGCEPSTSFPWCSLGSRFTRSCHKPCTAPWAVGRAHPRGPGDRWCRRQRWRR